MSTGLGRTFAFASERGALDLESDVNAVITDATVTYRSAERGAALWTR